ncbi:PaaI family thioesterase [Desulforhopalus sp. IMCC35007]|uniref:PaaI family thioesterase n=1 Tax=Desulforhopalus sp. IMCC35007 TaxID=2569543 RepID=UPI0010AE0155|nr:PaaI family thioesterase [Desulforhopalus sp. IMCC35007]TKB07034.1 PaaI family thioesterase [Desulforhopalus sp. IMCC35007]
MNDTFEQISVIGFMKHNGGMEFRTISETEYQFKTKVQDIHLNPGGITHGGFIMSLMDSGMGTAAHRVLAKNARAATISFDVKFISASRTGDVLLGTAKVLRKTRSLVFMQGELRSGNQLIATAEGIWKVL